MTSRDVTPVDFVCRLPKLNSESVSGYAPLYLLSVPLWVHEWQLHLLFCDLGCDKSLVSISLGFPLPRSVFITIVFTIIIYYNYLIYVVGISTTQASPETILSLS